MELKQVFETPDGQKFDTKAEALDHMRRPKILEALMSVTNNNDELSNWLLDNQELVEEAFDVGTIKRVTKSEKNKLEKALEAIKEAGNTKFAFVAENADAILESFRWPKVARMDSDEKARVAKESLAAASNDEVAEWIIASKDKILEAYSAGKEKRKVSPKAQEALATYRAKKAIEKYAADNSCSVEDAAKSAEITEKHDAAAIASALAPEAPAEG